MLMEDERTLEGTCNRFARHIIDRRTKPAGADQEVGAVERFVDRSSNAFLIIADDRLAEQVDAGGRQLLRQVGAVRINRLAQ